MNKQKLIYILFISLSCAFYSCTKKAGGGGRATIKGKVYAVNLTNSLVLATDSGYLAGINVYITYANDNSVGDKTESGIGGNFTFPYLQKGNYTVYAISKQLNGANKLDTLISKNIIIAERAEVVDMGDLRIYVNKN
jgi:hypothetical protein